MPYFNDSSAPPDAAVSGASFPRRVRMLLDQLQTLAGPDLERELERVLDTLEQDLFRHAEEARNPGAQAGWLGSLGTVRTNRHKLVARFSAEFTTALLSLHILTMAESDSPSDAPSGRLRLVGHNEVTESNVLTAIARRHESRAGLPLLLLGQRFGVMAGKPAFDATHLPVGPMALATMLSRACTAVSMDLESRLQLYKRFDRQMMSGYSALVESMNALLDEAKVLPGLTFVPTQARRSDGAWSGDTPAVAGTDPAATTAAGILDAIPVPSTTRIPQGRASYAPATPGARVDTVEELQALAQLHQLLAARRQPADGSDTGNPITVKPAEALLTAEVVAALGRLQTLSDDAAAPRTPAQLRRILLERSQEDRGHATSLTRQDNETFELLGLMYNEMGRELHQGSRGAELLERLQVPLLRVALQDRGFFVRRQHPARQLLDAIAEAGSQWLDGTDGEVDPRLDDQLRNAVDHVVENYDGDPDVFASAHEALSGQLELLARKAEVTQRRQVEAARGRDKLEQAKQQASLAIKSAIGDKPVPKFLATLLEQAWTDVLSLILLRHGEDSDEWREHLDATVRIIEANRGTQAPESLQPRITDALGLVGYQGEEANLIAGRLVAASDETDDPATRTELAMKLKTRSRLGANEVAPLPASTPRNVREEECYVHLRSLPFGSSIEFNTNQDGERVRRRLAWFSPITGRVLLLNHKGHRSDETHGRESLDQIARLVAAGEARVVPANEPGSLVDRAWQATLGKLRNFGRGEQLKETAP